MDDDYRRHSRSELMTDGERIDLLEHSVGVLQDQVAAMQKLDAGVTLGLVERIEHLERRVSELNQQLVLIHEDEPRQIHDAVGEAVDTMDVAMADLRQRVEERLAEFGRRLNAPRLEAILNDDFDPDIADLARRVKALEARQHTSLVLDDPQVARVIAAHSAYYEEGE